MQSEIIYSYYPLLASLLAMVVSQCVKLITMLIRQQPFTWSLFTRPGGMPSSHSALITAITLSVGLTEGIDSIAFFICVVLSFVVIYDARGIRHTVGNHARILNQTLLKDRPKKLNEQTGHTFPEILVGGALGSTIAWGMYHLLNF